MSLVPVGKNTGRKRSLSDNERARLKKEKEKAFEAVKSTVAVPSRRGRMTHWSGRFLRRDDVEE